MPTDEKALLLNILAKLEKFELLLPTELSVSELANMTGTKPNSLLKYIKDNFEPEEDYQKKGGKIYVKQDAVLRIRKRYA